MKRDSNPNYEKGRRQIKREKGMQTLLDRKGEREERDATPMRQEGSRERERYKPYERGRN